jgi:hypothetical protein
MENGEQGGNMTSVEVQPVQISGTGLTLMVKINLNFGVSVHQP